MALTKEQCEELCAAYAFGALEPEEQALFDEVSISGDPEITKILRDSIAVTYFINIGIRRTAPSPLVKAKLLKSVRRSTRSPFSISLWFDQIASTLGFGIPRFGLLVVTLLLVVIAEIGAYAYMMYQDLHTAEGQLAAYEGHFSRQKKQARELAGHSERYQELASFLQSPNLMFIPLRGTTDERELHGKVLWSPERSTVLIHLSFLPVTPENMVYQIWMTDNNEAPVAVGTFTVDQSNDEYFNTHAIAIPPSRREQVTFSVTLEQAGETDRPAGPVYASGTFIRQQ